MQAVWWVVDGQVTCLSVTTSGTRSCGRQLGITRRRLAASPSSWTAVQSFFRRVADAEVTGIADNRLSAERVTFFPSIA